MEETSALLANLVQTKSIERVLAPIAAQVSQLIIVNEAYDQGDIQAFPSDLVERAEAVLVSSDGLIDVANRLCQGFKDQELQVQLPKACDLLGVAGHNLVTAAHRVTAQQFSPESRRHLVRMAKDVLEGTLKVLLVSDEASVRRIRHAAGWVKERLGMLTIVKSMKHLVPAFKSFTEASMVLTSLVDQRQKDLTSPKQREKILMALSVMKKSIPSLSNALQTYVKYPDNAAAETSKDHVVGQLLDAITQLLQVVENKSITDVDETEELGHFVSRIDQLMDRLSERSRLDFTSSAGEFDALMEATVRHCMAVAHLSTEKHRELIIKNCQRVLQQRNQIADKANAVITNPAAIEVRNEFDEGCEGLIDEVQDLERHINASILQLVVEAFKETTETFDRLVKAALDIQGTVEADEALQSYTETFHNHSDLMCQVAQFVAASSSDTAKVREILGCVNHMELLDPELVPTIQSCIGNQLDKAAMEHLRLIKNEWCSNMDLLVDTLDHLTDPKLFMLVTEQELREEVNIIKSSKQMQLDDILISTRSIIGLARRLVQMSQRVIDKSDDPLYRNGLMVYVTNLRKVITVVKGTAKSVLEDMACTTLHEKLHSRCNLLLKCVSKVRSALDGGELPSLLSEARLHARSTRGLTELDIDNFDSLSDIDSDQVERSVESEGSLHDVTVQQTNLTEIKKKVAIKAYIAELVDMQLKELSRSVIQAALSGNQKTMDQLCTSALTSANHAIECGQLLATVNKEQREMLEDLLSEVSQLSTKLLDLASRVLACDVDKIEPLHETADQWALHVGALEVEIKKIVSKWKAVPDKVVSAAKMGNKPLMTSQMAFVEEHQKHLSALLSEVKKILCDGSPACSRYQLLHELGRELGQLTMNLATSADVVCSSGKEEEKRGLERLSCEWACKLYQLVCRLDQQAAKAVEEVTGLVCNPPWEVPLESEKQISQATDITIRVKAMMTSLSTRSDQTSKRKEELVQELDLLAGEMTDTADTIVHCTVSNSPGSLLAPHRLMVKLWHWAKQVEKLHEFLDAALSDMQIPLDELRAGNFDMLLTFKTRVHESLSQVYDLDTKVAVRRLLDEAEELMKQIHASDEAESHRLHRLLLCKLHQVLNRLEGTLDTTRLAEIKRVLNKRQNGPACEPGLHCYGLLKNSPTSGQGQDISLPMVIKSGKGITDNFSVSNIQTPSRHQSSGTAYENLKKSPQVVHGTPEPPSAISGFRHRIGHNRSLTSTPVARFKFDTDKWEDQNNAIVKKAKEMSTNMRALLDYLKATGPLKTKGELIEAAREIADNANTMVKFAKVLVKYSVDQRSAKALQSHADHIPTMAVQLGILTSVKAATPEDRTAEKMIVKSAETLMEGVSKMLSAAEAVCVKGFHKSDTASPDENEAIILATQWKRNLDRHRQMESASPDTDSLGLRKVLKHTRGPNLSQMVNT